MTLRLARLCMALSGLLLAQLPAAAAVDTKALEQAANGTHRSDRHKARNIYRHPVETLSFFGMTPGMTVVEITPGGSGWYTEVLAPYLRNQGKLYAAGYDPEDEDEYYRRNAKTLTDKLAKETALYDRVTVTVFDPPNKLDAAPPASADLVLTFRNLHNWLQNDHAEAALSAMYTVLKPGGVLGVVQHRAAESAELDAGTGYVPQAVVIRMAAGIGFEFAGSSEVNANPKDTKDYLEGVWTLPPTYELGDIRKEHYTKIGESDRMTLKFVKPERSASKQEQQVL